MSTEHRIITKGEGTALVEDTSGPLPIRTMLRLMAESSVRVGNLLASDMSAGGVTVRTEQSPRQVDITAEAASTLETMAGPHSATPVFVMPDGRPGSAARDRFKVAVRALRPVAATRFHEFPSDPSKRRGTYIT
ncbi:hypothetical protein [Streptomyces syringium]|uniref:hypothetical protein n=1 Tax=Streptomyces syringium TaxID=76729 RepID=UPI0034550741